MKKRSIYLIFLLIGIAFISSCKKDTLDFDKFSDNFKMERSLAAPVVFGEIGISELVEGTEDSVLIVDGDTVKLYMRVDSVFRYDTRDISLIPDQITTTYHMSPPVDIPVGPLPDTIILPSMSNDTLYQFQFHNGMRLDSIFMNGGMLNFNISNSFHHDIDLVITSNSIENESGELFYEVVRINQQSSSNQNFSLDNHLIRLTTTATEARELDISFQAIIYKTTGDDILASQSLDIDFSIQDVNNYEVIFGFIGYPVVTIDTVLKTQLGGLEKITGIFNVSNPKINMHYFNSFGVQIDVDAVMLGYFTSKPDVNVHPPMHTVDVAENYTLSETGIMSVTTTSSPELAELISFPITDSVNFAMTLYPNNGLDSMTTRNWVVENSEVIFDLEVEIPMEFRADLTYPDTISLEDMGLENKGNEFEINYINLHYWFENQFPVGFTADLVLYDSINNVTMDTITMSRDDGSLFLEPAPTDEDGLSIISQVVEQHGVIEVSGAAADNLLGDATHLIIIARIITTDMESARILIDNKLKYKFGIEVAGKYEGKLGGDDDE